MSQVYFFTGFPGFIANQLIHGILTKYDHVEKIYVLVLPTMKHQAKMKINQFNEQYSLPDGKISIIEGDITKFHLGIDEKINRELETSVTRVFHLAAIYDLAVPKGIAYRVNVDGTRNVNEWVQKLQKLQRYTYFSTAYIAGTRTGLLKEDELIRPPGFKNYYEETKYEAELLVHALKKQVPVTIIRPGIVKGHSKTGETVKFDGPYLFLNMMDRLRNASFFPKMGNPEAEINLVPIDFIVEAVLYLSHADVGVGKTYHLTDPKPYKVPVLYEMMLKELLGVRPRGKMPLFIPRFLLSFASIRKALRIEKETLDYLTWMGKFDCTNAQKDLQEVSISCPDLKDQMPSMIRFYLENKDNDQYHIVIR